MKSAHFRFYEELNDFLPASRQKTEFVWHFRGKPSIKDAIESLGVPHTEVDLILINGRSVSFEHHLFDGDRISVYPVFESLDISPVSRLGRPPLRDPAFICDVHLGRLARLLRMLGFDTLYSTSYSDPQIVHIAGTQRRIILTRDRGVLKRKAVCRGYWVRSRQAQEQVREVVRRFDCASAVAPFSRCMVCNALLAPADRDSLSGRLPPAIVRDFHVFYRCSGCERIYWRGSHYDRMCEKIQTIIEGTTV